jgi:hypothetical protein
VRPTASGHPYGLAALQAECAELAAAPKGERNRQLWESARNLYNLVAGGVLDQVEVDQAIRGAAERCGLLEDEPRQTEATLASARKVGLAHPRGIPDRTRSGAADASPGPSPRPSPERPQSDDHRPLPRSDHKEVRSDQTRRVGWAVAPIPAKERATAPTPQEAPVGPTRTVPPNRPATPRPRRQLAGDPLDLDRPSAAPPEPPTPTAAPSLTTADLDDTRQQHDLAADLLAPEPLLHRPEGIESRFQPPKPLGRRTPEPLEATRHEVER